MNVTSQAMPQELRTGPQQPAPMEIRHGSGPEAVRGATTAELRRRYLVESLFEAGRLNLVYSYEDRTVIGGAVPSTAKLRLEPGGPVKQEHLLDNREAGILHIGGGAGVVSVDGEAYELGPKDCLYVGRGKRSVELGSLEADQPARFYIVSTAAHRACPTQKISLNQIQPAQVGAAETSNRRRIYKYILPDQVESCSLLLGVTVLEAGDTWNTMPAHTHDRRSEIYLYFDLEPQARVFHFMGEPAETRHLVVANQQAVISPSWSIHSGSGTTAYSFCWAMSGENMVYNDMDFVDMSQLR